MLRLTYCDKIESCSVTLSGILQTLKTCSTSASAGMSYFCGVHLGRGMAMKRAMSEEQLGHHGKYSIQFRIDGAKHKGLAIIFRTSRKDLRIVLSFNQKRKERQLFVDRKDYKDLMSVVKSGETNDNIEDHPYRPAVITISKQYESVTYIIIDFEAGSCECLKLNELFMARQMADFTHRLSQSINWGSSYASYDNLLFNINHNIRAMKLIQEQCSVISMIYYLIRANILKSRIYLETMDIRKSIKTHSKVEKQIQRSNLNGRQYDLVERKTNLTNQIRHYLEQMGIKWYPETQGLHHSGFHAHYQAIRCKKEQTLQDRIKRLEQTSCGLCGGFSTRNGRNRICKCKKIRYCGRKCQKIHGIEHKNNCPMRRL